MDKTMDFVTAKAAIDSTMSAADGCAVKLLLMGGEPFLAFGLMKEITAYIRQQYPGRKVMIKTVTNGTLVHFEVQRWLEENKDIFMASLSLDGTRETHNRNRCGSYDNIDFGFFTRIYGKKAEASMVACPENLESLAHSVKHVESLGFTAKCVLADDCKWDAKRDVPLLAEQLGLLIEHYIGNPEQIPVTLLRKAINLVGHPAPTERCRPGKNSHCITADNHHLACHRCSQYYNNDTWAIVAEELALDAEERIIPNCNTCPAWSVCCACPALTASLHDKPELAMTTCLLFKTMLMANAAFVARLFIESPNHVYLRGRPGLEKKALIEGAQTIIERISI